MNTGDRAIDAMLAIVAVTIAALAGALLGFLASALDQQGHTLSGAMIAAWIVTREIKRARFEAARRARIQTLVRKHCAGLARNKEIEP